MMGVSQEVLCVPPEISAFPQKSSAFPWKFLHSPKSLLHSPGNLCIPPMVAAVFLTTSNARRNDPSTYEKCRQCGENRPVTSRNSSGKPLCVSCHKAARHSDPRLFRICSVCHERRFPKQTKNLARSCARAATTRHGIEILRDVKNALAA